MATPTPNPALNALPGETAQQYETRLGSMNAGTGTGFGTPNAGFSTQNVDANGKPLPQVMPPQVKSALEDTANADGNNINSDVPTRTTTDTSSDSSSNTSNDAPPTINDFLSKIGPAPTAPDLNADQTNEQNALGVPGLQTNLQTAQDNYANLQNQIQQEQAGEASKPGVISTLVNGRMKMLSAQSANALSQAKQAVTDATTALKNANAAVATFMKNDQTDFTNASAAYQKAYSSAISAYNDAESQANKAQTAAKANAQVIINSYKGSSVGINSITPDQEAQWTTLEQQAGLPAGTIKAAVTAELNITKFVKGSDGSMYVTGIDANGIPYTAQVVGSTPTGTWTKSQLATNTNKMSKSLQSAAGSDGFVSNGTYNAARTDWINARGTAASFDSAFKGFKSPNASANNS